MNDEKDIKVYMFYNDGDLCGFTVNKDSAKRYQKERPHCKLKKKCFSEKKYRGFNMLYSNLELFENVMNDAKITVFPITTFEENDRLEEFMYQLDYTIEDCKKELELYPLKDKVKKVLLDALNHVDSEGNINFDIITIFIRYIANYNIHSDELNDNLKI